MKNLNNEVLCKYCLSTTNSCNDVESEKCYNNSKKSKIQTPKMKSKKQNEDLKNTSLGKIKMNDTDVMISELLQNEETLKSFINASKRDGVSNKELQSQLKYFGVKSLSNRVVS